MTTTINADNGVSSGSAGLKSSADSSGVLALQTNGTTAISIDTSQAVSFTNAPTVTGGTANGVAYLNGSKVLTTGSALVFDGTNLVVGATSSSSQAFRVSQTAYPAVPSGFYCSAGDGAGAYQYGITRVDATNGRGFQFLSSLGASNLPFYSISVGTAASTIAGMTFSEALRIDSSGNLLVGTTTKNGDGKISISANSALNQGMTIKETSTTNDIYYILFQNSTGGTAGRIEHTGATTVSYTSGSDVRLKTNIVDAGSAKEKIESIKIREFDWITGEHQKFGVIAQELIEVAPEAVCVARTEDDYWGVDYSKLVPSLIKYVQEQQAIITQLQADVAALKGA